jgi:hypothetical protein
MFFSPTLAKRKKNNSILFSSIDKIAQKFLALHLFNIYIEGVGHGAPVRGAGDFLDFRN